MALDSTASRPLRRLVNRRPRTLNDKRALSEVLARPGAPQSVALVRGERDCFTPELKLRPPKMHLRDGWSSTGFANPVRGRNCVGWGRVRATRDKAKDVAAGEDAPSVSRVPEHSRHSGLAAGALARTD